MSRSKKVVINNDIFRDFSEIINIRQAPRLLSRLIFPFVGVGPYHLCSEVAPLTKEEFSLARKNLGKTQKELSALLGMSLKTIHSYEQGWRTIPVHIERQLYFLLINQRGRTDSLKPCWEQKLCNVKEQCPSWEFQSGHLCWFLSGTLCECTQNVNQKEKLEICKQCEIFTNLLR